MPRFQLSLASHDARIVKNASTLWVVFEVDADDAERLLETGGVDCGIESRICKTAPAATIIKISMRSENQPAAVEMWRSITSYHDVFYAIRRNGDVLISDQFRNVLAELPIEERHPSENNVIDFFIYNQVPGNESYCALIKRLGSGEKLSIDLATTEISSSIFDRIEGHADRRPIASYLQDIDHALETRINSFERSGGRLVNLFSGGVDSTLIQSYLGRETPAVYLASESVVLDSPFEIDYAAQAARALGVDLVTIPVKEEDYLNQLETTVDATAIPPMFLALAHLAEAFKMKFDRFIIGAEAAAIFGTDNRVVPVALRLNSGFGVYLAEQASRIFHNSGRPGLRALGATARSLSLEPNSLFGFGAQTDVDTEYNLIDAIFGQHKAEERLSARLDYVMDRVTLSAPRGNEALQHIELGQCVDYLCGDHVSYLRQFAGGFGKSAITPYRSRAALESALNIPVSERYLRGLHGKYLLKKLLKQRVAGYPAFQRKGYSAISLERYRTDGPLATIWDQYSAPNFVNGMIGPQLLAKTGPITWNSIAHAMWEKRVRQNAGLKAVPGSRAYEWEVGYETSERAS